MISGVPEIGKFKRNFVNFKITLFSWTGLPPLEPLKIDALGIENNAGNIRIKGLFTNVVNVGSSNFTVKEVRSDLKVSRKDFKST